MAVSRKITVSQGVKGCIPRNPGIPLRHIQEISGHSDLGSLQRYLEVTPDQRKHAVSVIGF